MIGHSQFVMASAKSLKSHEITNQKHVHDYPQLLCENMLHQFSSVKSTSFLCVGQPVDRTYNYAFFFMDWES